MDLAWKIRLVDRMIKNNLDATIKDYYSIVDREDENQCSEIINYAKSQGLEIRSIKATREEYVVKKSMKPTGTMETVERIIEGSRKRIYVRRRKKEIKLKQNSIV